MYKRSATDVSILVVEQDDLVREALQAFVAAEFPESQVLEAGTDDDASATSRTQAPDVIIVDVALPRQDGFEIIERLRSAAPNACIVALTREDEGLCTGPYSAGATVCLPTWQVRDRLGPLLRGLLVPDNDRRKHKTVVCVEDDSEMFDLIKLILRRHNVNTIGSLGGHRAVDTIREVKPDLVLLDLMMPGVSGWDVYQQLKADEETQDIPVIVVTVIDPFWSKKQGLDPDDVESYVLKPFLPQTLASEVNKTLRSS